MISGARSQLGLPTSASPHVVEAVLNHVSGHKSGVAGIYNRALYAKEKREALDRWARHLLELVATGGLSPVAFTAPAQVSPELSSL